jgi:hypothetical protein
MNEYPVTMTSRRNIWLRGLFMLLMAMIYHLSGTLLFIVVILQFLFALLNGAPNARLLAFGRSLGRYVQQIVRFLAFDTEDMPFPFSDWPSGS